MATPISDRRLGMARLAIIATVAAWTAYAVSWLFGDLLNPSEASPIARAEVIAYLVIVTLLTASTVAYLLSRLGFMYRARAHHRATRAALDALYDGRAPSLTALVPSYQEDAGVIRNTLLSVALQEYPDLRVVLLIDDPPDPTTDRAQGLLAAARALPQVVQELLAGPAARYDAALEAFEAAGGDQDLRPDAITRLGAEYDHAAAWLEQLAADQDIVDHTDAFLANHVIRQLAADLRVVASALHQAADERAVLPRQQGHRLYRRLAWTFRAELSSFERKRYASLSHEPNKAMNLNSYIGLMGGVYREVETAAGPALVPAGPGNADRSVPDPAYVLTVDADSVLLPEYCLRLVHVLEQQEHGRVAITQTPYSAFPGSATRLERIAGATTDLQHLVHQGLTYYDATFWVGANALIRKQALDDVVVRSYLGDFEIRTYIRDRTVIEDTESTVDLRTHGWGLLNYPERLSYSATPPDFGSLCIQRQRWATGGLLIVPKLRRQARARRGAEQRARPLELFLRWNYMASITWSSLSLLALLAFPFNAILISPLLGLVALPYFAAMASDLRYCGYKRSDVFRVYGFNLLLLPVNLAGSLATVVQALTASKAAFARTPKVRDRTVTPALFLIAPYVLMGLAAYTVLEAYLFHRWENLAYAALNLSLLAYAVLAFVGLRNSLVDAWVHGTAPLYKPAAARPRRRIWRSPPAPPPQLADWRSVLAAGGAGRLGTPEGGAAGALPPVSAVFQPVVDLATRGVVGHEALARLADGSSPERRLADAVAAGRRTAVEEELAATALAAAANLGPGPWLAVKGSAPLLVTRRALRARLAAFDRPVVVEIPEPSTSQLSRELRALSRLLPANVVLALEHVGVGHKSLAVLMELRPAFVKVDRTVIEGIGRDRARQAQLATLVRVAREHGCTVIAAGIETYAEERAIRRLGIHLGQGFLLGHPEPPASAGGGRLALQAAGAPVPGDEAAGSGRGDRPGGRVPRVGPRPNAGTAPRRQLSPVRALAALGLVGVLGYGTVNVVVPHVEAAYAPRAVTWFAPYVDATLTPLYPFQVPASDPARQVVLGFVVADPGSSCTPSWGAAFTITQADQSLAMRSRIAELAQVGASAIVSFGGQAHTDLAVACDSVPALTRAYHRVVADYHLRTIDFDVEGAALDNPAATQRRAAAIRALQLAADRRHQPIGVWITLPVEPSGLQANAIGVIDAMLRDRVDLAGVDVMAMDFASPPRPGQPMLQLVESAASAAQRQVGQQLGHYGVHLGPGQLWQRLGVTVMIGQNDIGGENFTVGDARGLRAFARAQGLGRVSMWSLNRDSQCGSAYAEVGVHSNTCSGTAQAPLAFADTFAGLRGTVPVGARGAALPPAPDTNPAAAPYPQWSPTTPYEGGYKVVRDGYIYQAKWYNAGQDPSQAYQFAWESPWELVGPVLPGDHAPPITHLPAGTYPAWAVAVPYRAGSRVLFDGLPYEAKWFNVGASPGNAAADPYGSPWQPLFAIPGEPPAP